MHPLMRWAVRIAYPYGKVRRIRRGPLRGLKYCVEPGMGASFALGLAKMPYEFLNTRIRPGATVYDVGANRGQMALFFARAVGMDGRVVAFEPVPELAHSLRANLRLNAMEGVEVVEAALADYTGTAAFLYSDALSTQGKLSGVESGYQAAETDIAVTTLRLDDYLHSGGEPPQIVKIDVEGAAALVLRGGRQLWDQHAPAVYIELHGPEEQAGVRDELLNCGYRAETLEGLVVEDPTASWHSPLWCYKPAAK